MSRLELFNKFYQSDAEEHRLFDAEYRMLKDFWDEVPAECRDILFELPDERENPEDYLEFGDYKIPVSAEVENVREVAKHYRYRLASSFSDLLPLIFRKVMILADDLETMELLFLGTMGALSACMPKVHGSLFLEDIQPNLFFFITGAPASGKGKIGLCRHLLEPLNDAFDESEYILPANTSDTALYEELSVNGGRGIIFESEADTLTAAFKKGSGKFSDGLRRAFHNEAITYMRRKNNERVVIPHPVLSMVITGTPGQVPLLFQSPENGLFSRFIFFRLMAERESFVDDSEVRGGVTGDMVNDYMTHLGKEVRDFYFRLSAKEGGVAFRLTEEQHKAFMDYFRQAANDYKQLFRKAYENEVSVEHADGIMKRMGNSCYRMMMVLSVSRLMERDGDLPDEVICDQHDFDRIMEMVDVFQYHNNIHYDELMVTNGIVPPLEEDVSINEDSDDLMNDLQREFFHQLPKKFTTQEAIQTAKKLGISSRSTARYLVFYCELGIAKCLRKGIYEKNTTMADNQ